MTLQSHSLQGKAQGRSRDPTVPTPTGCWLLAATPKTPRGSTAGYRVFGLSRSTKKILPLASRDLVPGVSLGSEKETPPQSKSDIAAPAQGYGFSPSPPWHLSTFHTGIYSVYGGASVVMLKREERLVHDFSCLVESLASLLPHQLRQSMCIYRVSIAAAQIYCTYTYKYRHILFLFLL